MTLIDFGIRILVALLLGGFLGLERQWRQHLSSLRTNALVSIGSALFVSITELINPVDSSSTRIAAQIVSGIGFLGAGFILQDRKAGNIKGLNTAATVWCAAAVGTLSGLGFGAYALIGSLIVVTANIVLKPVANKLTKEGDDIDG